jgi:hypothetical protein
MLSNRPQDRPANIDEIKQELIKGRNDFVARQKIDTLRNTVVPASSVVDPIVTDPIRVVGGEWELGPNNVGHILFRLNRQPPQPWQQMWRSAPISFFMNHPPEAIQFHGINAYWPADEGIAQQLITQFKQRAEAANREYLRVLTGAAQAREVAERLRLQTEAEAEERRRKVNAALRF